MAQRKRRKQLANLQLRQQLHDQASKDGTKRPGSNKK